MVTIGIVPLTATLIVDAAGPLISNIFSPAPAAAAAPSAAQVAAALARQRAADQQRQTAIMIGLGLAAAGVLAVVLVSRK